MPPDFKGDPDNPYDKIMRDELEKEMEQQAPDSGAILGYARRVFHQKGMRTSSSRRPDSGQPPPARFGKSKSEAGSETFTTVGDSRAG